MVRSGVARMVWATAAFALMGALIKALSVRFSVFEVVFWRCALSVPILAAMIRRRRLSFVPRNKVVLGLRCLFGVCAMSLYFWGLGELPYADVVTISRLQPLWVALIATLWLGERPGATVVACVIISLAGVVIIAQPSFALGNLAALAMVGSALAGAAAHVSVRRLSADDDPLVIVFGFTLVTSLVMVPLVGPSFERPAFSDFGALGLMAVFGTLGQVMMTSAYAVERAPVVSSVSYVSVVWAVMLGLIFWEEEPSAALWIGGGLVVGAGLILAWSRRGTGPQPLVVSGRAP